MTILFLAIGFACGVTIGIALAAMLASAGRAADDLLIRQLEREVEALRFPSRCRYPEDVSIN